MANPYSKYTGSRISPVPANYLQSTAAMSENLRKGLTSIGEAIGGYLVAKAEKEEEKKKSDALIAAELLELTAPKKGDKKKKAAKEGGTAAPTLRPTPLEEDEERKGLTYEETRDAAFGVGQRNTADAVRDVVEGFVRDNPSAFGEPEDTPAPTPAPPSLGYTPPPLPSGNEAQTVNDFTDISRTYRDNFNVNRSPYSIRQGGFLSAQEIVPKDPDLMLDPVSPRAGLEPISPYAPEPAFQALPPGIPVGESRAPVSGVDIEPTADAPSEAYTEGKGKRRSKQKFISQDEAIRRWVEKYPNLDPETLREGVSIIAGRYKNIMDQKEMKRERKYRKEMLDMKREAHDVTVEGKKLDIKLTQKELSKMDSMDSNEIKSVNIAGTDYLAVRLPGAKGFQALPIKKPIKPPMSQAEVDSQNEMFKKLGKDGQPVAMWIRDANNDDGYKLIRLTNSSDDLAAFLKILSGGSPEESDEEGDSDKKDDGVIDYFNSPLNLDK